MVRTFKAALAVGIALGIAISPALAQDLEQARKAFREGEYMAAFQVLEPQAQQGNPEAQFLLGEMFLNGYAIPQDPIEAARLFRRAARQGHAEAQFVLSGLLSVGLGVDKNERLAAQWNLKAARQGHAEAQVQMGYRFDLGDGVAPDLEEAVRWYVAAAENGAVDPNVGLAYCSGAGVPIDFVEGHFWLSVYLESNPQDERIREALGFCADEMNQGEIDEAEARLAAWRERHAVRRADR